jgi:DNA-binding transcriptional MocR family regulator
MHQQNILQTGAAACATLCLKFLPHPSHRCCVLLLVLLLGTPQVDSRALLQLASTQYGVKFAPGPVCQGPPNCVRLSFSFYEPQDLAMGAERLAAALQAYLSQNQ